MPIKFLLLGGGGGVGVSCKGGWKCQFYFYGRGDFSEIRTPTFRRFARIDSRESIRPNSLFLKHLARFARIASSLRFVFKFAGFASNPRCYPFSGRSTRKKKGFSEARIDSRESAY